MEKLNAIIYARTSSSGNLEHRQSTERQIVDLKMYGQNVGYNILQVFEEKISGAKKNHERAILQEAIEYSLKNKVDIILCSELSRLGRNAFEVMETIKVLVDNQINLYLQKEKLTLLDENHKPTIFTPILLATLSTCAQLERENIQFRLNSGRRLYIEKGGTLGRKKGSIKTKEQKEEQYKDVLGYLKKGFGVRVTSKITHKSESTVQRLKKEFGL